MSTQLRFIMLICTAIVSSDVVAFWVSGSESTHGHITDRGLNKYVFKSSGAEYKFTDVARTIIGASNSNVDLFLTIDGSSTSDEETGDKYHCDNEELSNCSSFIWNNRLEVVKTLTELIQLAPSLSKGEIIPYIQRSRSMTGYALHTVQDFYAHSNWIELDLFNDQKIYEWADDKNDNPHDRVDTQNNTNGGLVARNAALIEDEFNYVKKLDRATCASTKNSTTLFLAKSINGNFERYLSSGFYKRQPMVFHDSSVISFNGPYYLPSEPKIEKCQHGNTANGGSIAIRLYKSTGDFKYTSNGLAFGIHKDSPHRHLHYLAHNTAVEATLEFIEAIVQDVVTDARQKGYPDEYTDYVILKFLGHDVEPPLPVQEPPETPDGIQIEPDGDGLKYLFNKSFRADTYNIYLEQLGRDGSVVATFDPINTGNTDGFLGNLEAGTEYCFRVSAVNEAGESELSGEFCRKVCSFGEENCRDSARPVAPICTSGSCNNTNPNDKRIKPALKIGDPHVTTLDRFGFDLHMHGEVILTKSTADAINNLEIHSRPQRWRNRDDFSADTAYAMRVNEDVVGFYLAPELIIHVNSEPVTLVEGYNNLPSGGKIYKYNNNYTVIWLDNSQARVRVKTDFMEIKLYLTSRHQNNVSGIFGNYDFNTTNDLVGRDGTLYPSPIEFTTLYKEYGHSWRITNEESLFDYFEPGKSGTEDYTDLTYPVKMTEIDDFTDAERIVAEQLCNDGGVTIETPTLFKNCVIDIAATGGEDLFTDSYASLDEPLATLEVIPPKPVIIITSPTPDTVLSGNVVFRGVITGLQNVVNFNVSVNGGVLIDLSGAVDGNNFAFTLSSFELSEGDNRVLLTAEDSDGNIGSIVYDAVFDSSVAPTEGGDIVVINDINIFENSSIAINDNVKFVENIVAFSSAGLPRSTATNIIFDRGRRSTCGRRNDCDNIDLSAMRFTIANLGLNVIDSNSSSGSLTNIDSETKVIFFWLPEVEFTVEEIITLKQFANEGGRIVWIGEHDNYYRVGIPIQNKFLEDMGVFMTNIGGVILPGFGNTVLVDPENAHQLLESVQLVTMGAASSMELGPNDFALLIDPASGAIIAAVAKANINQP